MKLYRFEKLTPERCETIANNQLWLSSPKEFNDLNDCKIQAIYMPPLAKEHLQTLISTIDAFYPENFDFESAVLSKNTMQEIKDYIVNCNDSEITNVLEREFSFSSIRQNIIDSVGICCFFSGGIDEPLLWAHYADSHKGFCVEYEYNAPSHSKIFPVIYSTNLPIISARELAICPEEAVTRIVTSKTSHWQYEREFRLVELFPFKENESGKRIDIPDCLKPTRIITGDRLSDRSMLNEIGLEIISYRNCLR